MALKLASQRAEGQQRRPYGKPEIITYGTVAALATGSKQFITDNGGSSDSKQVTSH